MSHLDDIRRVALSVFVSPDSYIPTRYPWTYSADFVRSHPEVLPEHLRLDHAMSRAEASGAVSTWASEINVVGEELKRVFADCYLVEHHIPLDVTAAERLRPLRGFTQVR